MTPQEIFSLLVLPRCVSFSLIQILLIKFLYLTVAHQGEVKFYRDVDFKGPILYNFTANFRLQIEGLFLDCFNLEQSKGQPLSLRTSYLIILFDQPHCSRNREKEVHDLAIYPGEYPDLRKYLGDAHFPCRIFSMKFFTRMWWLTDRSKKIDFLDARNCYAFEMDYHCGCVNLPKSQYKRVRSVYTNFLCVNLFSETKCQGKSLQISSGRTFASEDLRRVSFSGVAISFRLCEEIPCRGANGTSWYDLIIRNGIFAPYFKLPFSLDIEDEEDEPVAKPTFINFEPPLNYKCENGTNFTCVTSCGGVLYSENGAIQYKLGESLESFERCVWVIKPPNSWSHFNVTQVWRGFKSIIGKHDIVISEYGNFESWDFGLNTLRGIETKQNVTGHSPMLIITLYTEELDTDLEESRGFILEYSTMPYNIIALGMLDQPPSKDSSDLRMDYGETLCYPSAAQYDENKYEISTFLFLPNNHMDVLKSGLKNFAVEISTSAEVGRNSHNIIISEFSAYRWIGVYPDRNEINATWDLHDKMLKSMGHDDMVLIMLKSNTSLPERAFCISSTVQDYKVCVNADDTTASQESSLFFTGYWLLCFLLLMICFLLISMFYGATRLQISTFV